jgi:hypothetical protein
MNTSLSHFVPLRYVHSGKDPKTISKNYSQTGAYFGIRQVNVGNTLLWPASDITRLLFSSEIEL